MEFCSTPSDGVIVGQTLRSLAAQMAAAGFALEWSEARQPSPWGPLQLVATAPPAAAGEPIESSWRVLLVRHEAETTRIYVAGERDRVAPRKERPCSARGS